MWWSPCASAAAWARRACSRLREELSAYQLSAIIRHCEPSEAIQRQATRCSPGLLRRLRLLAMTRFHRAGYELNADGYPLPAMVTPPSTTKVCPVMKRPALDA